MDNYTFDVTPCSWIGYKGHSKAAPFLNPETLLKPRFVGQLEGDPTRPGAGV